MLPHPTCLEFRSESVAGFPLHSTWFKTATSGKIPRGFRSWRSREPSLNRGNPSVRRLCYIIERNTDSRTSLWEVGVNHQAGSNGIHHFARYRIRGGVCSHCCVNPSLFEINLRPDRDSQSYRFVCLFEGRGKDDGVIRADCRISYIVPRDEILQALRVLWNLHWRQNLERLILNRFFNTKIIYLKPITIKWNQDYATNLLISSKNNCTNCTVRQI